VFPRLATALFLALAAMAAMACLQPRPPTRSMHTAAITVAGDVEAVVSVELDAPPAVTTAFGVFTDGQLDSEILLFGGITNRHYTGVLGPLSAGSHEISVQPSSHWATRPPGVRSLTVRAVDRDGDRFEEIRHAPAIWLRPDTIGTASDLPLVMYVEQLPERPEELQYSVIFSNEDGGTSTRALMARWGRTTDIEWVFAVPTQGGPAGRFQGQEHERREFAGDRRGAHPLLLVATRNNVFADSGTSAVLVRPVPRTADLTRATRESMMDSAPWIYALMARELEAEGKLAPWNTPTEPDLIYDPRAYVYLESRLTLHHAVVAAAVTLDDGRTVTSDGGRIDSWIARNGWVRTAVPAGPDPVAAVSWSCEPMRDPSRLGGEQESGTCRVEATRAFRLADDYTVGAELITATQKTLSSGEALTIPTVSSRR
jgi:hypothetical protein